MGLLPQIRDLTDEKDAQAAPEARDAAEGLGLEAYSSTEFDYLEEIIYSNQEVKEENTKAPSTKGLKKNRPSEQSDFAKATEPARRLKEDPKFQDHVQANLWKNRRKHPTHPWPWHTDVFEFISFVYQDYLGKGLIQSDIKALDPKLYDQFHQALTSISNKEERQKRVDALPLPKERSEAALQVITDPATETEADRMRRYKREKQREYRQRTP